MNADRPDNDARAAVFVQHARAYAALGWVLLDLKGKVPRQQRWQKTRVAGPDEAAGHWSVWGKTANMGVLLGPSGLCVVEPDTPGAHTKLLELLGGKLPETPIVQSGGKSLHLYFVDDGLKAASRDGLELRAGGQQCVLPPSVHPDTGRPYLWLDGHEAWAVPFMAVPEAVVSYFGANGSTSKAKPVDDEIREPGRHRALVSIAGTLRRRGLGETEILAALEAVNRERCRPQLPAGEVAEIAADIAGRYDPAPPDPARKQLEQEAERLFASGEPPQDVPGVHARRKAGPLIVSLVEFLGGNEDDAAWLVDHLAARGALVLVAGLPKVGKSTFVYGLLGALTSTADRFVGLSAGSTWALLMTEEPPATVEEKVDRFGIDDERVFVISRRKMGSGRTWPKTVAEVVTFCRAHPEVGVVVIDTWDKFSGLSASRSEADTGVIIESIEPLWELLGLGVCVILITHQRKQEGEHGMRVRGGTALTGSVDVIVEVERPTQSAGLSRSARIVKIVSRFAGAPDEFAVELADDGWRSLGPIKAAKQRSRREHAITWLTVDPSTLEEAHERAGGPSKDTVRRRLGELVRDGLAERLGDGRRNDPHRWQRTENGNEFLRNTENGWRRNDDDERADPADRAENDPPGFFASSPPPRGEGACKETVHVREWLALDGVWRCRDCEPPHWQGEIVEERSR